LKYFVLYFFLVLLLFSQTFASGEEYANLFSNGDVENKFVNQIVQRDGYRNHIEAAGAGTATFWRLTNGAVLCRKVKFSGENSIKLSRGKKDVAATVFSNYWKIKDGNMPFGLPLLPEKEIAVSFRYKTAELRGKKAFTALIRLGVVKDLPTRELILDLPASDKWKLATRIITLSELKWGAEIVFTLAADSSRSASVWIDDVYLSQQVDGINLIKNHSFEEKTHPHALPSGWQIPIEDQWVSWVGSRYREPSVEAGEAVSGNQSLRASVTYTDGSGVSQLISLHQKKVRPVLVDLWSKLDNSIGKRETDYWSVDNYAHLTVYVYHYDGTMQEVSPTFLLGESDHDWDYRRFGFMAQKPVKEILVQITVLGSEPTTSLWIDEVRAFEVGVSPKELSARGVDFPAQSLSSKWGNAAQFSDGSNIKIYNDADNIYLSIPGKPGSKGIFVYLNPHTESTFINHYRYLFNVIKIAADGQVYKGITVEKQGYTADGEFRPAEQFGILYRKKENANLLTVPYRVLQMTGVSYQPFGFNIKWQKGEQNDYWNGNAGNNREMGRIILAKKPGVRIKSIIFGKRYFYEKEQSQDFMSYPQIYTGMNEAIITVVNDGTDSEVEIAARVKDKPPAHKKIYIGRSETKLITLLYQAGLEKLTEFNVTINANGQQQLNRTYPIQVPPAIEIVIDQEFYFPEETSAKIEIHNRYRPIPKYGKVSINVVDQRENNVVEELTQILTKPVTTIPLNIHDLRINPLPVQDYAVTVTYLDDDGKILGEQIKKFGRINHTQRRKLPPIEKLTVDEKGRIVINDNFYFFPIVPSVNIMDWHDAIDLGANVYRGYYNKTSQIFEERDRAWEKNVYTLTIGPYDFETLDTFKSEAESLLVHPGFLSCYAKQFYYWNLSPELINFRKRVEKIVSELSSQRLVIWGHHDSSFLYDHDMPEWPVLNPPVGYCYVKIMGRPGSAWRNIPFQTRTEMILNPHRFKLAEVNYYSAIHDDEIVPEHFSANMSLRADDWYGVRNESYLSVIYGANGLYHWVPAQENDLQRLRGWFQELNYMWPVFVADDAEKKAEILPYNSKVDFRLKKWQGKYYLLTANRDETTQNASISINGFEGMKVKKLFELPGNLSVKDNKIQDVWGKYGTHVYEIENGK